MSTRSIFFIYCDSPDCESSFSAGLKSGWITRDAAKKEGWTVVVPERIKRAGPTKSIDLCPMHGAATVTNNAVKLAVENQEGK